MATQTKNHKPAGCIIPNLGVYLCAATGTATDNYDIGNSNDPLSASAAFKNDTINKDIAVPTSSMCRLWAAMHNAGYLHAVSSTASFYM